MGAKPTRVWEWSEKRDLGRGELLRRTGWTLGEEIATNPLTGAAVHGVEARRAPRRACGHDGCIVCGSAAWVAKTGDDLDFEAENWALLAERPAEERLFPLRPRSCARGAPVVARARSGATQAIVQERVRGTLRDAVCSPDEACAVGAQIVSALRVFHEATGRLHGDVAPENIGLRRLDPPGDPVLLDLAGRYTLHGARRRYANEWGEEEIYAYGRGAYAPPVLDSMGHMGLAPRPRLDLSALGLVLVELLHGKVWDGMRARPDSAGPLSFETFKDRARAKRAAIASVRDPRIATYFRILDRPSSFFQAPYDELRTALLA